MDPFQQQQQQHQQMQRQHEEMRRQQQELQRQQQQSVRDQMWRDEQRYSYRLRGHAGPVAKLLGLILVLAIFAIVIYVLTHFSDVSSRVDG